MEPNEHLLNSSPQLLVFLAQENIPYEEAASDGEIFITCTSSELFEIARSFQRYVAGEKAKLHIS